MRTIDPAPRIKTPWWNVEAARALCRRDDAQRLRENNDEERELQRQACRTATRMVSSVKSTNNKNNADSVKMNPKEFYRYVNERKIPMDSVDPLMDAGGVLRTSPKNIANVSYSYFDSVFTVEGPGYEHDTVYTEKPTLNNMAFARAELFNNSKDVIFTSPLDPWHLPKSSQKNSRAIGGFISPNFTTFDGKWRDT